MSNDNSTDDIEVIDPREYLPDASEESTEEESVESEPPQQSESEPTADNSDTEGEATTPSDDRDLPDLDVSDTTGDGGSPSPSGPEAPSESELETTDDAPVVDVNDSSSDGPGLPTKSLDSTSSGENTDDNDTPTSSQPSLGNREAPPSPPQEPVDTPSGVSLPEETGEIAVNIGQISYTTRYLDDGNTQRPVLHLFGKSNASEGTEHVKIHGFEPYFYVPVQEADGIASERGVKRVEGVEESIRGQEVRKVVTETPRVVGRIRDDYTHYEADIRFPDRFMIDKELDDGIRVPEQRTDDGTIVVSDDQVQAAPRPVEEPPSVATIDIEVEDRNGFPDPEAASEQILCITAHDSATDAYTIWLLVHDNYAAEDISLPAYDGVSDRLAESASEHITLKKFSSEAALANDFINWVGRTSPTILTGWSFPEFDADYLVNRFETLNDETDAYDLDPDQLSRVGDVWAGGWGGPDVKGRVVLDLLEAYEATKRHELDSSKLEDVAQNELGTGKERFLGDVGDLWEDDPETLLKYNLKDVELCVELDTKLDIIPFWEEVKAYVGCRLEDAPTAGRAVDMYVLQSIDDTVLPSKGMHDGEEFEGGAVFDPSTDLIEMVATLDLKSLYPMVMTTINASPETKVDPEEYDGDTYVAPNGLHFKKEPDGIIRQMVDDLLSAREEKKALRDEHDPDTEAYDKFDRQQRAIKVIMNSLYGTMGWEKFRLYDAEMSAAVTATGREVIKFTEEVSNELGYEVVYGDTDSVLLSLEDVNSKETAIEQSLEIEDHINDRYDEFAQERLNAEDHGFQIEFEKLYRRFLQAGKKKRYAGHIIFDEGKDVDKVDITGFEYKRSDIAAITKEVQKQTITMLVNGRDTEDVTEYISGVVDDFQNGEIPIEDIGIPAGINQELDEYDTDTAQVRGAKAANVLFDTNFRAGSKPMRLYLSRVHPEYFARVESERELDPTGTSREDQIYCDFKRNLSSSSGSEPVICFDYASQVPDDFKPDWDKMLDKTLAGPIGRVLEAVDTSWEDVKANSTQQDLGQFV